MKMLFSFLLIVAITQPVFAMSDQQLSAKVNLDPQFIQAVESSIKSTFRKPAEVAMTFQSAIANNISPQPFFNATYKYYIKAGRVTMGSCTFVFLGSSQGYDIKFVKLIHEDCGE